MSSFPKFTCMNCHARVKALELQPHTETCPGTANMALAPISRASNNRFRFYMRRPDRGYWVVHFSIKDGDEGPYSERVNHPDPESDEDPDEERGCWGPNAPDHASWRSNSLVCDTCLKPWSTHFLPRNQIGRGNFGSQNLNDYNPGGQIGYAFGRTAQAMLQPRVNRLCDPSDGAANLCQEQGHQTHSSLPGEPERMSRS